MKYNNFVLSKIMDTKVKYLQSINFTRLTLNEKIEFKRRGRPTPNLNIQQSGTSRSKVYSRQFNVYVYEKCDWLCGCDESNALFCYPCLLYGGDSTWTEIGVTDLNHLQQRIRKHEQCAQHMNNMIDLTLLGKVNIAAQIDTANKLSVAEYNERVRKNRDVLSKITDCVKFFGKFQLLRRHDETTSSKNPEIFRGLLDFACEMDSSLKAHLNDVSTAAVFKGTSTTIQNELLESMFNTCQERIREEVNNAKYLAVMCEENTDIDGKLQLVIVLRYEVQGKPVERFWGFFNPVDQTAEASASVLLNELRTLIGNSPEKLIAQTYDGAPALSGVNRGAQARIKEMYNNAHFIHCYAHQLNHILEQATSQNKSVRIFFNSLSGIPAFFSRSPQRMAALENVASHIIPNPSATHWNFKSRTVNAVHEMKAAIYEYCNTLEASNSRDIGCAAARIKITLNDPEFEFWLEFFSKVMPHIDVLFSQFQSRNIDAVKANVSLNVFNSTIQKIRDESDAVKEVASGPKRNCSGDKSAAAKEVCDVIMKQCKERFSFVNHLAASRLLLVSNFPKYARIFPSNELEQAVKAYPMLEQKKLRTELRVLYTREYFCNSESLVDLLEIINESCLQSTLSETVKLIKIMITTPMITDEVERCFSTLKRIQTFLRNTAVDDRLSALAMISIENKMITEIKDFNEKVANHFATSKCRHIEFIFK
ncbi:zinc finger MYM-type protein 1-like [Homarus americanus]|uniref:zinc finger MYM-type protein 1-like n=1 Tax=Homarus americanus TaxID=6706 RepID=UPI001C442DAB|nr:zinc finger MYM-type protein 1-like [Homarus americanus]